MPEFRNLSGARVGERGPQEHRTRVQILEAADGHFRQYGYNKTTVADLARVIGTSPAYVYRFFESKQAIGEAVVGMALGRIVEKLEAMGREPRSATERLRRLYPLLVEEGLALFFHDRKLHEIVIAAVEGNWAAVQAYKREVGALLRRLIAEGRQAGEFERETPLDDAALAINTTLYPFMHPVLLEQADPAELRPTSELVAKLILRSLAP